MVGDEPLGSCVHHTQIDRLPRFRRLGGKRDDGGPFGHGGVDLQMGEAGIFPERLGDGHRNVGVLELGEYGVGALERHDLFGILAHRLRTDLDSSLVFVGTGAQEGERSAGKERQDDDRQHDAPPPPNDEGEVREADLIVVGSGNLGRGGALRQGRNHGETSSGELNRRQVYLISTRVGFRNDAGTSGFADVEARAEALLAL